MAKDKCSRGFVHKWELIDQTATHDIKECAYCKGKRWAANRRLTPLGTNAVAVGAVGRPRSY